MKVEISVKVDGEVVEQLTDEVNGTLEQMEEKVHALGQSVACKTLQASVNAASESRPPFRRAAAGFVIKDIEPER